MTAILIVTRPAAQGVVFAQAVADRARSPFQTILSPLLRIVSVSFDMIDAPHIIFTSVNAVTQAKNLEGLTAWCVGQKTAQAAKEAGFFVQIGLGTAAELIEMIVQARPKGPLVHLHGEHTRGDVVGKLLSAGLQCYGICCYRQDPLSLTDNAKNALRGEIPVVVPLFSPRTTTILEDNAPFCAPLHFIAVSAAAMPSVVGASRRVVQRPEAAMMIDATVDCIDALGV